LLFGAQEKGLISAATARDEALDVMQRTSTLADYRVVYFATHGLVAGDVAGLQRTLVRARLAEAAEPSLTTGCSRRASSAAQA
jgi:hypothetical protein